jgi:integrase/recombinase XerD
VSDKGNRESADRARRRKAPPNTKWRGDILYGRTLVKGREHCWSLRTGDVEIARKRVEEEIARLKATAHGTGRARYQDMVASWIENHIEHQVGALTARRYAVSLRQLEDILYPLFLDEIDKAKIDEIVMLRRAKGVSTATIRRDLTALSSVLEFAEVDFNPALAKTKKLTEKRDPIVMPEAAHIERVLDRAPPGLSALARAAWLTGCRLSELATAQRARLDHARRQLTVVGKGNKLRTLDLSAAAYDLLRAQPPHLRCKWLFWHGPGESYKNVSSRFSAIVRAEFLAAYDVANPPDKKTHQRPSLKVLLDAQDRDDWRDIGFRTFRFHDLRHRFAVDWLKSGRSIYDLKEHLGHSSVKTTEIYLKYLTPEEKRAAMYGVAAAPTAGASDPANVVAMEGK